MNEAALVIYGFGAIIAFSLGWNGYQYRFLPIARPFTALAYLMAIFSCLRFFQELDLELSQWFAQAIADTDLLASLTFPFWVWMLLEYHYEKQIPFTNKLLMLFYIHPFVQVCLVLFDISSNGFVSQESLTAIIDSEDRLGAYASVQRFYAWSVLLLIVIFTPYVMIKKQRHSVWDMVKIMALTPMPFLAYAMHKYHLIELRLSPMFFIFYLFWISRQYRLLDVMPVALPGIIDKVDSGILVSNMQSKLLFVNEHAKKMLSLDISKEAIKHRQEAMPEQIAPHFDLTRNEQQDAKIELKDPDDSEKTRYIDAVLRPILHPKSHKHLGATVSLHDVTERQQTELQLQSFDRQKSEFFAGISHEFRTPLTLSLGNLDDVLEDLKHIPPEQCEAALLGAKTNNQRLLKLVNQLLELSCLESGAMQIQPTAINVVEYLPSLIANFESQAHKQHCRLSVQFSPEIDKTPTVYFDVDAFDKVILNLISNALKSMPDGGDLTVKLTSLDEDHLQLSVSDKGCGIPAASLPKVFEMFYSHKSNNTAWPKGAGVGLSLVKQLLAQHSGDISVESHEGKGTTFTLTLRKGFAHFSQDVVVQSIATDATTALQDRQSFSDFTREMDSVNSNRARASSADDNMNLSHELSEKLVLLVDDNAEMRAYIRKHLAKHFRLIEAADGEEGLALALQATPDLVLSDVMMPKMNGFELCEALKSHQQTSHIPVLLLTAKSSQAEKLEGLELGADDYLSKPFDVKELTLRMNNLIASRLTIQELYQSKGLQKVICNPELPKRETSFLDKLQRYVQDNISNADIKVSDLAQAIHMSERSLSRKLKALTGDTPKKMLLVIRLEYAKKILTTNLEESITQVAYQAGFADASHFTRSFKAHYSMTPTQYRNS